MLLCNLINRLIIVALDIFLLAICTTLSTVFACVVAFHFIVYIESYNFLKRACRPYFVDICFDDGLIWRVAMNRRPCKLTIVLMF